MPSPSSLLAALFLTPLLFLLNTFTISPLFIILHPTVAIRIRWSAD